MIRVLIVDDQPLVRTGLRRMLRPADGFDVVGECADGAAAVEAANELEPDIVIMDIRMKGMDGIEATRRLRSDPDGPPVLVLTTFDEDEVLSGALRAGANGFQLKDAPGEDLIRATRAIAEGGAWLDPSITGRVLASYRRTPPEPSGEDARIGQLSDREIEVLRLVARGATNGEIASELVIGEATVKSHIGHIFVKLGLRDRAAAIVYAYDSGIARPTK